MPDTTHTLWLLLVAAALAVAGCGEPDSLSIVAPSDGPDAQDMDVSEDADGTEDADGPEGDTPEVPPDTPEMRPDTPEDEPRCEDPDGDGHGVGEGCLGMDCDEQDPERHGGAEERCNGVDDNCDGRTDEGFSLGEACAVGDGVCRAEGLTVCGEDGLGAVCGAEPGLGGESEVCGNGLDDDCNGEVDDGLACLNECADEAANDCHPDAECLDRPDGFDCACQPGFEGDGRQCDDIDECAVDEEGSNGCGVAVFWTCRNQIGLPPVCEDIDECGQLPELCGVRAVCRNEVGGVACDCDEGFGDCDEERAPGCETPLDTVEHCRGCGVACAVEGASSACDPGLGCVFVTCDDGFYDINADLDDGCEYACEVVGDFERCNGNDDDCDGVIDDDCRPDPLPVARREIIEQNLHSIWDIDFDEVGNVYLTSLISGTDFVRKIAPDDTVQTFFGLSNQDIGMAAVKPDGSSFLVRYSFDGGAGAGYGLVTEDNALPHIVRSPSEILPTALNHNNFRRSAPTGCAWGPDDHWSIGNHEGLGNIHRLTDEGDLTLWATLPEAVLDIKVSEPDRVFVAAGSQIFLLSTLGGEPVVYATFEDTVFSIAADRYNSDLYAETLGATLFHVSGSDRAVSVFQEALTQRGFLEVGPDDNLYRVRGLVDTTSVLEIYPLSLDQNP